MGIGITPAGKYRLQIRRNGIPRVDTVYDTLEKAQKAEADALSVLKVKSRPVEDGSNLLHVWWLYQQSHKFTKKRPSTQATEKRCSKHLMKYFAEYHVDNITLPLIQRYIDRRASQGTRLRRPTSADTVRLEKQLLRTLCKFAITRGYATTMPNFSALELPKIKSREVRILPADEAKLIQAAEIFIQRKRANRNLLPWLVFTLRTGMRAGESARIELAWIQPTEKGAVVNVPSTGHKTNRPRVVVVPESVIQLFNEQRKLATEAESKYLFWSIRKDEAIPYQYQTPWRKIGQLAGVRVVAHAMRHEFISRMFEQTRLNDSQIALLAGDVNVISLKPYKHLRSAELAEALHRFSLEQQAEYLRQLEPNKPSQ